jgi:uncharacterized protein YecE (DUF72 family)
VKIHIGTSGWHYKHWLGGVFYPEGTTGAQMFEFYARHFDTVEINNSFYHLPKAETFDNWRDSSPRRFCFAVKASRFTTHMKKLKDPERSSEKFFLVAERLREKLGPILFQLHCIHDFADMKVPHELTARFTYIRFHGPTSTKYYGWYSKRQLREWAERIESWRGKVSEVYVYFNNDPEGAAVRNALELKELVSHKGTKGRHKGTKS